MKRIFILSVAILLMAGNIFAFEEKITVPAEDPKGVTLNLEKGRYMVTLDGGAITLFYPINPNYRWLAAVAVGTDSGGGQDEPNIGMIFFEPDPPAHNQAEAEQKALAAVRSNLAGTSLEFVLNEDKQVRFWVSDFDYTDNSGMIKLKVTKLP